MDNAMVCTLCHQQEVMDRERWGTKRRQVEQSLSMLTKYTANAAVRGEAGASLVITKVMISRFIL